MLVHDAQKMENFHYAKLLTVPEGEAILIRNFKGESRIEEGPKVVALVYESFRFCTKKVASAKEYLVIQNVDGTVEHKAGPASVFVNPKLHERVEVKKAIQVPSGYAIVVYTGKDMKRKLIRGPADYLLGHDETLHTFFWQLPNPKSPTVNSRTLVKFNRLRVIPDSLYLDLEQVRTRDDALLTIQLMIFFHLKQPEVMFDNTHDPVGELINCVTADVVDFVSAKTFEEFKAQSMALNQLHSYSHVVGRMLPLGYELTKIVFRGFSVSTLLQSISNQSIEARTRLRLDEETEAQSQDLKDLEQRRGHQRRTEELAMTLKETQAREEAEKRKNAEYIAFYKSLSELGVDLTQYLTAAPPDHHLKISGPNVGTLKLALPAKL